MDKLKNMPGHEVLINWFANEGADQEYKVNSHIHTPYSFSCFDSVSQIFELAHKEDVRVLGINDFFVTDGYDAFHNEAVKNKVFPLFNIEFIGLLKEEQVAGIRVNDPNNPGRTYFCGKGLDYPVRLPARHRLMLEGVKIESQKQVVAMIDKTNLWLNEINAPFTLDYDKIKDGLAKQLVRERHIAKAIRLEVNKHFPNDADKKHFLANLYGGVEPKANLSDYASLEGELRERLLKMGGKAFVPEDERAFPEIGELVKLIIEAGGIPCYPVLLDDKNGKYTEFEEDFEKLYNRLVTLGVYAVELIPNRNSACALKDFVNFFDARGFLVSFGTEHNSPDLIPLTLTTRDSKFDNTLTKAAYKGACIVAAHQYLRTNGEEGYLDATGRAKTDEQARFSLLGKAVIERFLTM